MSILEGCLTTIDHHVFHPRAEAMTATAVWFRAMPNKILREFWVADERQVNTNIKHAQTMSNMVKHPHVSRVYHEFPSSRRFRELHISQPFLICLWPELLPKNNRLLWGSSNFGFRFQSTLLYKWRKCTISSCSSRAGSKLSYCDASIPISKSKSAHSESFRSLSLLLSTAKILTYFDCAAFHYLSHAREWRHSHLLGSLASCHMQRSSAAGAHLDASGLAYHEWAKQITGAWNRMDIFGCHWRSLYT